MIQGDVDFCAGESSEISVTPIGVMSEWSTGEMGSSITVTESGDFSVVVTDLNGCTSTAETSVQVSALPIFQIDGLDSACSGDSIRLSVTDAFSSYEWSTGSTDTLIYVDSPDRYEVTVTDANGCSATQSREPTFYSTPLPTLPNAIHLCHDSIETVTTSSPFITYLWQDGSTDQDLTVSMAGLVSVTVTDSNGCIGSSSVSVTQSTELNPLISGSLTLCVGNAGILRVDDTYDQYLWSTGSTTAETDIADAGVYSVTVTDMEGCTASSATTVTLESSLSPRILGDSIICAGDLIPLATTEIFDSYEWSTGENTQEVEIAEQGIYTVTVSDAQGCTGVTSLSVTELPVAEVRTNILTCDPFAVGIFLNTTQGIDSCTLEILTIELNPNCDLRYDLQSTDVSCSAAEDGSVSLEITGGQGPFSYRLFDPNGELIADMTLTGDFDFSGLAPGTYTLIIGDNALNEFVTETFTIFAQDDIPVSVLDTIIVSDGTMVNLEADLDVSLASRYAWFLGDDSLCADNCLEVEVSPTDTTLYTFSVTSVDNVDCQWSFSTLVLVDMRMDTMITDTMEVLPDPEIYLPTVFRPDDSGPDGTFGPLSGTTVEYELTIYDRWGNLIHVDSGGQLWDGRSNGQLVEQGMYVYKLVIPRLDGSRVDILSGAILLLR